MPLRSLILSLLLALGLIAAEGAAPAEHEPGSYHPAYILVDRLPAPQRDPALAGELATPQASVEWFLRRIRAERYAEASLALNTSRVAAEPGSAAAGELARQLAELLERRALIGWSELPDRPDGMQTVFLPGAEQPMAGQPRRSIRLGIVEGPRHPLPVSIARYKPRGETGALWLFSPTTVEAVPALYRRHGPGWLEQRLPGWSTRTDFGGIHLWEWVALALFLGLAVVGALGTRQLLRWCSRLRQRRRAAEGGTLPRPRLDQHLQWPLSICCGILLWYLASATLLSLTGPLSRGVDVALLVGLILSATWAVTRLIRYMTSSLAAHYERRVAEEEDPQLRKQVTSIAVAGRLAVFLAVVAAIGIILNQLHLFRTVGIALLASAGAVGIILTIAGGPVLGNLIAGLQVGLTRPVDIGDVIDFDGHYGWVEDITYTYLVVRIWNERRLIVPLRHFVLTPFQNLSKASQVLVRPVRLHVDYRIPVARVREEFERFVTQHEDFDDSVAPRLVCLACHQQSIELQGYVCARDPSTCWWFHCAVREHMLAFIQRLEDGRYLPRERVQPLDPREPVAAGVDGEGEDAADYRRWSARRGDAGATEGDGE